jgi:hypothetical protein
VSGLEVFEERAHQHARASESRRTGHDGRIANDDGLHVSIVPQVWAGGVWRRLQTGRFTRPTQARPMPAAILSRPASCPM